MQTRLNIGITNINLVTAEELNRTWAVVIQKGGTQPKHKAKSSRCLSMCLVLANSLDLHAFRLLKLDWDASVSTGYVQS